MFKTIRLKASKVLSSICAVVALLAVAQESHAFGRHSRFEIGYSYVMATGEYKGIAPIYGSDYKSLLRDSTVKINVNAYYGLGAYMNINFPLRKLTNNSTISLSLGAVYQEYLWLHLNPVFKTDGSILDDESLNPLGGDLVGATLKLGVPISLDYKVGADALCKRNPHFGFTGGVGLMPQVDMSAMGYTGTNPAYSDISAGITTAVKPFVKGEFSFFLGICFKVKVLYSFGSIPLIDHTKNVLNTNSPFTLTEKSNITTSVGILPFSFLWRKKKWFNEYETKYEIHENYN